MHLRSWGENFLNNLLPVPEFPEQEEMDRVGFKPTTSAMPAFSKAVLHDFLSTDHRR
jgi:hypothetical protein